MSMSISWSWPLRSVFASTTLNTTKRKKERKKNNKQTRSGMVTSLIILFDFFVDVVLSFSFLVCFCRFSFVLFDVSSSSYFITVYIFMWTTFVFIVFLWFFFSFCEWNDSVVLRSMEFDYFSWCVYYTWLFSYYF